MSTTQKRLAILLGIVATYCVLIWLPTPEGLSPKAQKAIALMFCAVLVWCTEVLPLGISAVFFTVSCVCAGIMPLPKVMANFADASIFFVFAMFCNAIAFQNSGLCQRVVLWTSVRSNGSPAKLSFYLMAVTGAISMVLADIPAISMMFPIGLMLLNENGCQPGKSNFGRALMLGLPLAALIGGVGTPAGSSMNVMTVQLLQSVANTRITFFQWTMIGIPMVAILIPVTWWVLRLFFPYEIKELRGMEKVREEYARLGPLTPSERAYFFVFLINLALWSTDSLHRLPLPVVAVMGAALFFVPGIDLIRWKEDRNRVGWDILLLIGASTAIGKIIWQEGGSAWLANVCLGDIAALPTAGIIAAICLFVVAIHLLIPVNTAIVAVLLPTLVSFAQMKGLNPALLAIPMGFSVSASLLLPLGPVPLVTYPGGYYRMFDLFRPGLVLTLAWVVVMTACMLFIASPLGLM